MPYGDVSKLPAKSKAVDHAEGNVYRTILEPIDQGHCTIEVAFDEKEKPSTRFLVGK